MGSGEDGIPHSKETLFEEIRPGGSIARFFCHNGL